MELYKILLVDDEEEVRTSMIKKIEWEKLGFQVVGDAENGEDALEKVSLLDPDLVLTDIKMPYMDGLKLAERLREEREHIEIIVFSGFDEFEYAKQAIKFNVLEYILKPVNAEELTEILCKIKNVLDKKNTEKRNIDFLRENYQKSMPIIKEHFLTNLIHGTLSRGEIKEGIQTFGKELLEGDNWAAASLIIEIPGKTNRLDLQSLHQEKELVLISVQQILDEKLSKHYSNVTFRTSQGLCIIIALKKGRKDSALVDLLSKICRDCNKILEISVTIGLGGIYKEIDRLKESYLESKDAVGYKAAVGSGMAISIGDVENIKREYLKFDERSEGELLSVLKFGTYEQIMQVTRQLTDKLENSKTHVRERQIYIISVLNSIMGFMQKYELDTSIILGKDNDYFEIISQLGTPERMQHKLADICLAVNENMNQERNNTAKNLIGKAKEYISDNFSNSNLSVEMVCEELHISQAYFSTIFKKETGQSYVNYLTELRLNRAIELLNKTDDKTYIIASKVGYTEPNYFSYVFKKKFGMSPSKYRGR